jgi:hypothetical protein
MYIPSKGWSYTGRNEEYLDVAIRHALSVGKVSMILRFVPELLKP